ncbi:N-acetyl-gamma-glutamyl-phosphate reductase (plasmid) [Fulvitalea axinellae]|uniref:N-acetyl-gamma-glutamyl-phosphate reductase n=1 Tax=Fulvitalea axinellae TaxID=1182444 RepID=A0AAU9CY53_9BACT|nr:N-acetyl-gamma-glutamyl-phosphate reductase [Fulvitalea axinellae]
MIKVGIAGAAGYTAGELLRLLINHPETELVSAQSNSQKGKKISDIHTDLEGETDLCFDADLSKDCDVVFLCMGHGKSREFMETTDLGANTNVIDLSHDFRLADTCAWKNDEFIYGLPELNKDAVRSAKYIANPGCFATGIQLSMLPLAKAGKLGSNVHVHGVTGSTGAGQRPTGTTHFSWRDNNVSVYKAFGHQHVDEIVRSWQTAGEFENKLHFVPVRGNFSRGIFISAYTEFDGTTEEAHKLYSEFYEGHPFTIVSEKDVALKQAVNTNKCLINVKVYDGTLHVTAVIDNLLKGASGQALHNMNLMFGLEETLGLKLKPSAF